MVVALGCRSSVGAAPHVFLLDPAQLETARQRVRDGDQRLAQAVKQLRRDAQRAMTAGPFSVVQKEASAPSGDKRDYMSLGTYWWPNPDTPDGLPYVRRDGEPYPGISDFPDHRCLNEMSDAVDTLALAYFFTNNEDYAKRAALLLRTWFIDPATRMNPNLQYGQAIRGINNGRGTAIIETRQLVRVVDSVGLLAGSQTWTRKDQLALEKWFDQYLHWLLDSKNGRDEAKAKNNHGTYYDLQVASFALFVGNEKQAASMLEAVKSRRIAVQIEPDGRQPLELARTKTWSYSVANLTGLMSLAAMAERVDVGLWTYQSRDGRSIRKAIDFLLPYAMGEQRWPYPQISGWKPDILYPVLRRAKGNYPHGPYVSLVAKIPAPKESSRRNLLPWQLEPF